MLAFIRHDQAGVVSRADEHIKVLRPGLRFVPPGTTLIKVDTAMHHVDLAFDGPHGRINVDVQAYVAHPERIGTQAIDVAAWVRDEGTAILRAGIDGLRADTAAEAREALQMRLEARLQRRARALGIDVLLLLHPLTPT